MAVDRSKAACLASLACRVRNPVRLYKLALYIADLDKVEKKYLKALLLSKQNGLHTLINLIRSSIWVGNLISSADLLLKTLLKLGLSLLVLLRVPFLQVTAGNIDLSLNAECADPGVCLIFFKRSRR